jgi:hypothetical protein
MHSTACTTTHCTHVRVNLLGGCWLSFRLTIVVVMLLPAGLPPAASAIEQLPRALPSLMLFAITWSLGASCDKAGRAVFDAFLREKVAGLATAATSAPDGAEATLQLPEGALMPASASVYEWCYDRQVRALGRNVGKIMAAFLAQCSCCSAHSPCCCQLNV